MIYIFKIAAIAAVTLVYVWANYTPTTEPNRTYPDRSKMRRVW